MAKEFYTEGTGSNQVLHSSQTEKIPVYDSQQDAESDLANLEENQIVFTKDLGLSPNDWKQYISDENELSDIESIDLSTQKTMEFDGFISVTALSAEKWIELYDGTNTLHRFGVSPTATVDSTTTVYVKKGDKVKVTNWYSNCAIARFYKKRHYEFR